MKLFFDTEFTGLNIKTTLISLGIISQDGRTFYAEFNDYDANQVDKWIKENVIDNLLMSAPLSGEDKYYVATSNTIEQDLYSNYNVKLRGNSEYIKKELATWLAQFDEVELVSDVAHYDMVLFINIFGTAFDLPSNVSAACHDINQDLELFHKISSKEAFDMSREDFLANTNKVLKELSTIHCMMQK